MAFKSRRFQRVALGVNDRFERILRRHPALKRRVRGALLPVQRPAPRPATSATRCGAELAERFREPNERLAAQLRVGRAWRCRPGSRESRPVGTP